MSTLIFTIWTILAILLFLYFIMLCFKALGAIKEKLGLGVTIFLVIGLLSFMGNKENANKEIKASISKEGSWDFVSMDSIEHPTVKHFSTVLKNNLLSKYNLDFTYGIHKRTKELVPIHAHSGTEGLVSGTKWTPIYIDVHATEDGKKLEYLVEGVIEWNLLNMNFYAQEKSYKGFVLVEN